ncbi:hypothetical protein F0562_003153 [Nyssa sinensis]|uniref:Uncharacterized protein n=1 Tax=Nyssa sinensis TaxID=561372 RepID=A0A5J5BXD1_9ASTE|nr:hypothetical protein F0562_003153 [Nyssa sinensis]
MKTTSRQSPVGSRHCFLSSRDRTLQKPGHLLLLKSALERQTSNGPQSDLWIPLADQGWKPCAAESNSAPIKKLPDEFSWCSREYYATAIHATRIKTAPVHISANWYLENALPVLQRLVTIDFLFKFFRPQIVFSVLICHKIKKLHREQQDHCCQDEAVPPQS